MDDRKIPCDLMERLPDGTSLRDIARKIEFIAALREGAADLDRGEAILLADLERGLPSWLVR